MKLLGVKNKSLAFMINIKTPTDSQRKIKQYLHIFRNSSDTRPVLTFTRYNKEELLQYLNENDWITTN